MFQILIVEDDKELSQLFQKVLEKNGYQVKSASDGVQALEVLDKEYIDLIISDIMMPVMDGLTATKEIRSIKRDDAAQIPIIAMTANAFEEDKRDAIAAGMNGHIAKPIQVDKLLSILSEVIRKQSLYRLKNGTMGKTDDVFADNVIY